LNGLADCATLGWKSCPTKTDMRRKNLIPRFMNSTSRTVLIAWLTLAVAGGMVEAGAESAEPAVKMRLVVEGQRLVAHAPQFIAEFEGAMLVSVRSRSADLEFCRRDAEVFPVESNWGAGGRAGQRPYRRMTIRVDGAAGKRYQLESSPDLIDWTELHVLDNGQTI
jgi:hypothetical protein